MATGSKIEDMGRPIARLFGEGSASGMDEGELLRRFAHGRDPVALEVLVARHGPMVLGVCRRVLGKDRHGSEDAFQATFLVLAKRAGSIRDPDRLGPWLHGVAHRVAVRARSDQARRNAREKPGAEDLAMETPSSEEAGFDRVELKAALDEELRRLPEKFRDPIILCYLDGLTHDEAATRLHCPVGTVRSRLSTARAKLRDRLGRRGVAVPASLFAAALTAESASAAVSPPLLIATVKAATAFEGGLAGAMAAGMVSAEVASLAEGVSKTMIVSKLKIVGALALSGMLTVGAGGVAAYQVGGAGQETKVEKPADETDAERIAMLKKKLEVVEAELSASKAELERARADLKATRTNVPYTMPTLDANNRPVGPLAPSGLPMGPSGATSLPLASSVQGGGTGMSLGGRGMGGMGANKGPASPLGLATIQMNDYVIVHKPKTDRVAGYSAETGEWAYYEVPKGVEVIPISGPGVTALHVTGDEIGQIATYAPSAGRWFPINLKETAKGPVTPIVGPGLAVYAIGRRVYAFGVTAKSWDVLELPEGAKPTPHLQPGRVSVEHDDHLYIFSLKTGKWADLDTRAGQVVAPAAK